MINRHSLYLLPTACLIVAALIVGFATSKQPRVQVNSAVASAPAGRVPIISSTPLEPRGPMAEVNTPAPETKPTSVTQAPPAKQPAPKTQPKPQTKTTTAPKPSCSGSFTTQFICLLNDYRASKGLNRLAYSSAMAEVAANYSAWMNQTGIFSHTGENGTRFTDRCAAAGIKCYGENLAKGAKSPQNLLDMWKASPSHNANMLRQGYTAVGLGLSGSYATMLFQ